MPDDYECPDWFADWVERYATAFTFGAKFQDVMLRYWWPAFATAGFTAADCEGALQRMVARSEPPAFPKFHFALVRGYLTAQRVARNNRAALAAAPLTRPDRARCKVCEDRGTLQVPHPADMRNGEWNYPHRTGDVTCSVCPIGAQYRLDNQRKFDEGQLARPMMGLDAYASSVNAAWREQLAEREEAKRLMRLAEDVTENTSDAPPLVAALLARLTPTKGA